MDEVADQSVDLVVTSPPYWNLKEYGDKGVDMVHAYAQYLQNIRDVLVEVKRVIRPGRFVCLNVGTAVSNDGMESIPADVVYLMRKLGFIFKKEIIWVKPKGTQGLWQRGVTKFLKRFPYPCHFNANIMHEYILIFQKPGELLLRLTERDRLPEDFIKKVGWSVWEMPVSRTKGHPAPFPEELPKRIIRLYTVEGETVLDPFGGTGTTMKAARDLNRNCVLYEINSQYLPLIKKKVEWGKQELGMHHSYEMNVKVPQEAKVPNV
ncbi:MAG: site-specific DNA-methyltransferase [Nitrososphaerota archaeon]